MVRPDGSPLAIRGETRPLGQYTLFTPRGVAVRAVHFYDQQTKRYGLVMPRLTPNARYTIPRVNLVPLDNTFVDSDSDGLPDAVELVYGTNPFNRDSDGDGVSDGAAQSRGRG